MTNSYPKFQKTFLLFLFFAISLGSYSQNKININEKGTARAAEVGAAEKAKTAFFARAKRARPFSLNSSVKNENAIGVGQQVQLQLFEDKDFSSRVLRKSTDVNGVTTYTLKLENYKFAYAYLSVSADSYLMSIDIPELNEKYTTKQNPRNNSNYIFQLDEENLDIMEGCEEPVRKDKGNGGINRFPPGTEPQKELDAPIEEATGESIETNYCLDPSGTNGMVNIDLMIVYTPAAKEWADLNDGGIDNTIATAMAKANSVSTNSGLGINFNLAYSGVVNYTEVGANTDLYALLADDDGVMDDVHSIRKNVGADVVSFLTLTNEVGGLGFLLDNRYGDSKMPFSLTRVQQASGSYTFVHELGHNLGISHYKYQNYQPGPTSWSNWPENTWSGGWRWLSPDSNMYCDVMTYTGGGYYSDGMGAIRLPYFSNPSHDHLGIPAGDLREGDAVRTLKEMKRVVAQYSGSISYCEAYGADAEMAGIDKVLLGQIENSSGKTSYSDFSSISTCIFPQETQILQVQTSGESAGKQLLVWIDWNADEIFDNETELVYSSVEDLSVFSADITAPLGVIAGPKRVRLRLHDPTSGANPTPCGDSAFGEVEDYSINVMEASACSLASVPQDLHSKNIESNFIQLAWTPIEGISSYELRFRKTGEEVWNEINDIFYSNLKLEGLAASTEYEIMLRSRCGADNVSDFSAVLTATTTPALSTLAFIEQPVDTQVEIALPDITVELLDVVGNRSSSTAEVSIQLVDKNATGGTLSGRDIVQAENGLAVFKNLVIDVPGTYALAVSIENLPVVESDIFQAGPYSGITYTVNTSADNPDAEIEDAVCADADGNCSLRAAIANANKTPGKDKVIFNIPGEGPHKISLLANLPKILYPLDLDATSQPGYLPGAPQIVISGVDIPVIDHDENLNVIPSGEQAVGLHFVYGSSGSSVIGLAIGGFGKYYDDVYHSGVAIQLDNTTDHVIQGNFIGLEADGKTPLPNVFGMVVGQPEHLEGNNLIGGTDTAARNIISGSLRDGLHIGYYGSGNEILNNYFGTNKDGKLAVPNNKGLSIGVYAHQNEVTGNLISGNEIGLEIRTHDNQVFKNIIGLNSDGSSKLPNVVGIIIYGTSNRIGGAGIGNWISGNYTGIHLSTDSSEENANIITGNYIGPDVNGNSGVGNEVGIDIAYASNSRIGGKDPAAANIIVYNGTGVGIGGGSYNNLTGNQIFGNTRFGIDLGFNGISANDRDDSDRGPNNLQNYPELMEGAALENNMVKVDYLLTSDPFFSSFPITLDFYKSDGNRQGAEYLGSSIYTTNDIPRGKKPSSASIALPIGHGLMPGDQILATATDANGNTSEFSASVVVTGNCTTQTWYADADLDGFGINSAETNVESCVQPEGSYVTRAGDCDDANSGINPEAPEINDDGIDQNCDGEDATSAIADKDADGVEDSVDNCPDIANADQADTNSNGIGDACESTTCLGTDILNLTDCTSGSLIYWTLSNPGNCAVDVRWEVRKGSESGSLYLNAGESNQFTTSVASRGQTQVIISWNMSNGTETKLSANASGTSCSSAAALTLQSYGGDLDLNEAIVAYPNPIGENGFYLNFPAADEGKTFSASIYNSNGQLLLTSEVTVQSGGGEHIWSFDHSRWDQGVYTLILKNDQQETQIRLMKN